MLTSRIRVRVCGSELRERGIVVVVVVVVGAAAADWSRKGGGCGGEGRGACGREGKNKSRGFFFGGGCQRRLLVC